MNKKDTILKDYVLSTEVQKIGKFKTSNISMFIKKPEIIEGLDYMKFGGITVINKSPERSNLYPNYIKKIIQENNLTDLTNLIPYSFLKETLENNLSVIKGKYRKVKVQGKQFVEMDYELKDIFMLKSLVRIIVDDKELEFLVKEKLIQGYLGINNNKTLCWY